jgi:hypothetical protein
LFNSKAFQDMRNISNSAGTLFQHRQSSENGNKFQKIKNAKLKVTSNQLF